MISRSPTLHLVFELLVMLFEMSVLFCTMMLYATGFVASDMTLIWEYLYVLDKSKEYVRYYFLNCLRDAEGVEQLGMNAEDPLQN